MVLAIRKIKNGCVKLSVNFCSVIDFTEPTFHFGNGSFNLFQKSTLEVHTIFSAHQAVVEDVCWHASHENIFGSVGDDMRVMVWDTRNANNKPTHNFQGHQAEINCISFNPSCDYLFATGNLYEAYYDMHNLCCVCMMNVTWKL